MIQEWHLVGAFFFLTGWASHWIYTRIKNSRLMANVYRGRWPLSVLLLVFTLQGCFGFVPRTKVIVVRETKRYVVKVSRSYANKTAAAKAAAIYRAEGCYR